MKISLGLAALACLPQFDAHGHYEWAGVFELKAGEIYTLTAQADHGYHTPTLTTIVYPVETADKDGITKADKAVDDLWHTVNISEYPSSSNIEIDTPGVAAVLRFNNMSWLSPFFLHISTGGKYGIFAEADLMKYETRFHYLQDDHGHDIEPVFVTGGHGHDDDEPSASFAGWMLAVGGTFLTTLPAVVSVACIGPGIAQYGNAMTKTLPFASGAVGGVAVFLILPEALYMIPAWLWGAMVLFGWVTGVMIHHLTDILAPHHNHDHNHDHNHLVLAEPAEKELEVELAAAGQSREVAPMTAASNEVVWKAALPILAGDAVHALVDGIVIGFSAKICGPEFTWAIVFATIVHEVPVELSTLTILVLQAKMGWKQAAMYNFFSAQVALIGAVLAYGVDISEYFQGVCLAATGGIFLFIAFTELAPSMVKLQSKSCADSLLALVLFSVGATALGLVLLNHQHCTAGGGHGHDHGHAH